jgi:hypothetical protein
MRPHQAENCKLVKQDVAIAVRTQDAEAILSSFINNAVKEGSSAGSACRAVRLK